MTESRHAVLALHPIESGTENEPAELLQRRQIIKRTRLVALVVLVLLLLGAGRTVLLRHASARALESTTAEQAKVYVKTTLPLQGADTGKLSLPGTLQGVVQAPIAARASGYLKRWTHDIGARVEKGELLAEIATPELDQQLSQAIATREQTAASLALARSTVARWEALHGKDLVSQQELDERRSAALQAQANLAAADANVQRLRQLEDFSRVVAPFAGIVTRRNVDVGDLIDGGAGARPLFMLAQTDALRVYVNVPQAYAHLVHVGQEAVVTQGELRGRSFPARVARTASAIDTATRTMQVEVALANPEGVLLPGAYVQVALPLASANELTVPTDALLFRSAGTQVAVVDAQGRVQLRTVTLGRNFGRTIELRSGLGPGERMVLNPADSLADGDVVALAPDAGPGANGKAP